MSALDKAIDACGSQAALARALGIKQQNVSAWVKRGSDVPAEYCRAIEEATGGTVTRYELRPDVFGPSPDDDEDPADSHTEEGAQA